MTDRLSIRSFPQTADPEHWSIESLETAVRVAKIRAGLDPEQTYPPAQFYEHLGPKWEPQFWARQVDRVVAAELASSGDDSIRAADADFDRYNG